MKHNKYSEAKLSKIRFNFYGIFQVFFSLIILTLFLCMVFPTVPIVLLVGGSVVVIGLLIFFTNKLKDKPLKRIPIEKRYLYEKIVIGFSGLIFGIAALSILAVIVMFLFEKEKDGFDYIAMAIIGVLGFVCLYFGILLTKIFVVRYKSFEIYRRQLIEEEFTGFRPSK